MIKFVFIATNKNATAYKEDPSFIYRCDNPAFGILKHGYQSKTIHISRLLSHLDADIYIFHRPKFSLRFFWFILLLKLQKKIIIADIDDLIFDPKEARHSPAYINGALPLRKVQRNFFLHQLALRFFSHFTVSTQPLKEHIRRLFSHANVIVISNSVHYSWHHLPLPPKHTEKIIGYFPGTKSHDKDFAYIADVLQAFLRQHPHIRLHITGKIDFRIQAHPNQIIYQSKVPFDKHHTNYQNIWVNIAPLENTPFNACKSALKVIEAGFFNIPTITMPNADTKRFENNGALIAKNSDMFIRHLESLLDPNAYRLHSDALRNKIDQKANVVNEAAKLIRFCENHFPLLFAKKRRQNGRYDKKTLKLFIRAYLRRKTFWHYLAFASFCRDLGYPLSQVRYRRLHHPFRYFFFQKTYRLLCEYKKQNPFMLHSTMRTVYHSQASRYKEFQAVLQNQSICIVGNGTGLKDKKLGKRIDSYDMVVRFNHCTLVPNEDLGSKTDVWVSAPNITYVRQAEWIVLSGPYALYHGGNWRRFHDIDPHRQHIVSIPLHIWKELVAILRAPPSAGILFVYWVYRLVGSFHSIAIAGFDIDIVSRHAHYHETNHTPSIRHNWKREKALLKIWIKKGLHRLENSVS